MSCNTSSLFPEQIMLANQSITEHILEVSVDVIYGLI